MILKLFNNKKTDAIFTERSRISILRSFNIRAGLIVLLGMSSSIVAAQTHTYDCRKHHCGLISDGPYQHVILGTVTHIATANEEKTIYHWAKKHGYWKNLSGDEARFYKMIQIVSVKLPKDYGSKNVTLLMGQNFFKADIICSSHDSI